MYVKPTTEVLLEGRPTLIFTPSHSRASRQLVDVRFERNHQISISQVCKPVFRRPLSMPFTTLCWLMFGCGSAMAKHLFGCRNTPAVSRLRLSMAQVERRGRWLSSQRGAGSTTPSEDRYRLDPGRQHGEKRGKNWLASKDFRVVNWTAGGE